MRPSEVRHHILSDHRSLSEELAGLEELCDEVLGGEPRLVGPLRNRGERLLDHLTTHMRWEDRYLAQALRQADAWGEERARELEREHRAQRSTLGAALAHLRDESRPAVLVARELSDLVQRIRTDMVEEEEHLLDDRVLRDDVIGVDVETG